MSKTCPHCGALVNDELVLCDTCGFVFEKTKGNETTDPFVKATQIELEKKIQGKALCERCGSPLDEGSDFCQTCGYRAVEEQVESRGSFKNTRETQTEIIEGIRESGGAAPIGQVENDGFDTGLKPIECIANNAQSRTKKNHTLIIVLVIVGIIVAAVVTLLIFLSNIIFSIFSEQPNSQTSMQTTNITTESEKKESEGTIDNSEIEEKEEEDAKEEPDSSNEETAGIDSPEAQKIFWEWYSGFELPGRFFYNETGEIKSAGKQGWGFDVYESLVDGDSLVGQYMVGADGEIYQYTEEGYVSADDIDVEVLAEDEENPQNNSEYLLPDADSRYYTRQELEELGIDVLHIARNEVFARHGRIFDDEVLNAYFSSKSWYQPQYTADEFDPQMDQILNEYEKTNINAIKAIENGSKYLYKVIVNSPDGYVVFREGVGTDYKEIEKIPNGELLSAFVETSDGKWLQTEYQGTTGWIEESQVQRWR